MSSKAVISNTSAICPLSVSIPATRMSEGQNPATLYVVLVKWGESNTWTVAKRFAEFDVLHASLSKKTTPLPQLPAKTWFKSFEPEFIEQRRKELEVYMQSMLNTRAVVNAREFHQFLGLTENASGLYDHVPAERIVLKDPKFGVNAHAYDHKLGLLFTASEDTFVLSRLNSYVSNTRMPWESAPPPMVSVGAVNVWQRDDNNSWACTSCLYYDTQATAIAWDSSHKHVYVGLDTGMILCYELDIDASQLKLINETKSHSARVTALVYDRNLDRLMSVGRDKKLILREMSAPANSVAASGIITRCGDAWISSIVFDEPTQRVLLGTYAQQLMVYDVSPATLQSHGGPRQLAVLDGQKGSVRALCYDASMRYCFAGGFDYSVCMWDIGTPGKEGRSTLCAAMKTGPQSKVKAVVYCPTTRFVVAGYENGMIAIYNTLNAELMLVMDAHASDVVSLQWLEEYRILISAARDCDVKFWLFPEDITKFRDPADAARKPSVLLSAEEIAANAELERRVAEMNLAAQKAASPSSSSSSEAASSSFDVDAFEPKAASSSSSSDGKFMASSIDFFGDSSSAAVRVTAPEHSNVTLNPSASGPASASVQNK